MKSHRLMRAALAVGVVVLFSAGPASAMGKKGKKVEKEHQLGKAGTMKKSYDPETGVKRMEKTIGHGEKTMTLEKERHSGATVERSWKTGSETKGAFPGLDKLFPFGKGKGKGKGKWK